MYTAIQTTRERMAKSAALLFSRQLLDLSGGNITVRVGDVICMTPSYSGQHHQWNLQPEDILVISKEGVILDGTGKLSRETKVHLKLHEEFGAYGTAVIHAHAKNVLVFAAMNMPIPPVLEATQKFGIIPSIPFSAAHSGNLAENVAAGIRGNESRITKQAAAVIAPWHGLFLIGKDLENATDAVERIDTNAYILLMSRHLGAEVGMQAQRDALTAGLAAHD